MTRHVVQEAITNPVGVGAVSTASSSPATDPVDCPFIVRVRRSSDQAFLGTAFFVSPTLAIGCLHYLKDKDLRGQPTGHVHTDLRLDFGAHQVEGRLEFKDVERDFVGIRIDQPSTGRTIYSAQLAKTIDAATLDSLCVPRNLFVKGYLGREGGVSQGQIKIRNKPLVQTEHKSFLRDAQFSGGWSEGFSGSPLLARHGEEWVVLGMAYLGGERSGNSRVLLADAILEVLKRECPDEALLKPVPAQQLVNVLSARKSRQRALYVGGGLTVLALLGGMYSFQDPPPAATATPAEPMMRPASNVVSQTLAGVARDSASDLPLAGVTIRLSDFPQSTTTNENGGFEFTVPIPSGDWVKFSAHKDGYEELTEIFESGKLGQGIKLRRKEQQ